MTITKYSDSPLSIGKVLGMALLVMTLWLASLMPFMPGAQSHVQRLLAFLVIGATIFTFIRMSRRYRLGGYLYAAMISAMAAPVYYLFHPLSDHPEWIFGFSVMAISAQWGLGPGLLAAILSTAGYAITCAFANGHPDVLLNSLILGGFFLITAFIVGTLSRHRETALVNRARLAGELEQTYEATLRALSAATDLRDHDTQGHSERVTALTQAIAQAMPNGKKIDNDQMRLYRWGALLHDIGKIGIPDNILRKPGSLNDEEWKYMRLHPQIGYEMLRQIPFLQPALDIVLYHHEKYNGSGYPYGLKGEAIPHSARIFAVADVFDALTSDRPYRQAFSVQEALAQIQQQMGQHFDPEVVRAFEQVMAKQTSGTG